MSRRGKPIANAFAAMGTDTPEAKETKGGKVEVQGSAAQADRKRIKTEHNDSSGSTLKVESPADNNNGTSTTITTTNSTPTFSRDTTIDIDTRLSYRQSWPLLPVLPVHTSRDQVPKTLSRSSPHLKKFRSVLRKHRVTIHTLEIAHRLHARTPISKTSLTLLVHPDVACNEKWESAIRGLRSYVEDHSLTLGVEIIDHRIVDGLYTLPILSYDSLTAFIARRKHGIIRILNECGEEWTSVEFFYRGLGRLRDDHKATVLIGVPEP